MCGKFCYGDCFVVRGVQLAPLTRPAWQKKKNIIQKLSLLGEYYEMLDFCL